MTKPPRKRGPQEYILKDPRYKAEINKRLRKTLPPEKRRMRYSELKIVGAIEAGYKVDPEAGVVLGKRGKPLKLYIPQRPDGTQGPPLVDVRTKLPFPFHKTKIDVSKAVAMVALGPKAIHGTTITQINGNKADNRISNLSVR